MVKPATLSARPNARLLGCLARLKSIRVQDEGWLRQHAPFDSVVVVGSTCAGKTTLVNAVRKSHLVRRDVVVVPLRYITRSKRGQDNTVENAHLILDEFQQKVRDGDIGLHWIRKMEGEREEHYGFQVVPRGKFPVYSGNNALYSNAGSIQPRGALKQALFLGVYAPDSTRRLRLLTRSPDLLRERPEEVKYRLGDLSKHMLPHIHVLVNNHGSLERLAEQEVVHLIGGLVDYE